jgi:hypothetical protein
MPPGELVTLYPVMLAGTPAKLGALNDTVACPAPAEADALVGAPGTANVVIEADGLDDGPFPILLVAKTVKVYDVFVVKPVIVIGELAPLAVKLPGDDTTVYDVKAGTPKFDGTVKLTDAVVVPVAVADTLVGAPGGPGQRFAAVACIC